MSQPYTTAQMTIDCLNFIQAIDALSPSFALFYRVQMEIGSRFHELTDITRFQMYGDEKILFQPAKGNNLRALYVSDLQPKFVRMVELQESYFDRVNYFTSNRYFQNYFPRQIHLYNGLFASKRINAYIFRYRKFKLLAESGLPLEDIGQIMGEIDIKNVEGYVNADIRVNI